MSRDRSAEVAAAWDALPTRTRGELIADPITHELAASAAWLAAEVAHPKRARQGFWRAVWDHFFGPMSPAEQDAWMRGLS